MTSEPDGKYRFHFTPEEAVAPYKPAYMEAKGISEFLVSHGVDKTLEVVGGDSTNFNTGWIGGALVWLAKMLGRNIFWIICQIHTNKLPLRHLMSKLDRKTSSREGWTGPIGKLLVRVNDMERNYSFSPISGLVELIHIPQDIVTKMSADS